MISDILSIQFWAMEPNFLKQFLDNVQSKSYQDILEIEAKSTELSKSTSGIKPYKIENNIAVIGIKGPLLKRVPWVLSLLFGIQSMEQIGAAFNAAIEDSDIDGVFLHVDSPGSEISGVLTLSNTIFAGRGKKPVLSYIDGSGTSGAYWIASAADQIVLSDSTTRNGNIGIIGTHMELSEAAKKAGVGVHVFSAGKFKKIGNQFEKLSKDDIAYINSQFEYLHDVFIKGVERNLGKRLPSDAREAKTFIGQQAISVGLADSIMTKDAAMAKLKSMVNQSSFTTSKSKTSAEAKGTNDMKYKNVGLKEILTEIQSCDDIDQLAKLEQGLVQECQRRKASATDWIQEQNAETLRTNVTSLVSQQYRMILAQTKIEETQRDLELGKAVGRAVLPNRCSKI
jgi:signal peptide peptidase SppA